MREVLSQVFSENPRLKSYVVDEQFALRRHMGIIVDGEIVLDRKVADKRIFPALDVGKSGTRKEELLVEKDKLSKMWVLRRILMQMGTIDAMEFLLDKMKDSKTNEDFFATMNQ